MREEFKAHSTLYKENQILSCGENGRNLQLETKEAKFYLVKIDGGVEQDNKNRKCDFIIIKEVINNKQEIWIYVECKGKKIKDACEQVWNTYNRYKQDNALKYIAIIGSRFPKNDTSIQVLEAYAKQQGFKKVFPKGRILKLAYDEDNLGNPIIKRTN